MSLRTVVLAVGVGGCMGVSAAFVGTDGAAAALWLAAAACFALLFRDTSSSNDD